MTFGLLSLICLVALVGPVLAVQKWVHVPSVLGLVVVGLGLGTTGFGVLDPHDHTFRFLADIGFALVMFVAGTHMPVRSIMRDGFSGGLFRAALIGVAAVPVGWGIATLFNSEHALLFSVLLASSSAALVMPILSGQPLNSRPVTSLLTQLAVADAACIVALPLALQPSLAWRRALGAALVIIAGIVFFLLLRWVETKGWRKHVHQVSEDRKMAVELRTSLVVLFGMAALATAGGVSIMLAGFVVGVAFAAVGEPRRLAKQVFALTEGFFGPLFFVWFGAGLNLRALVEHPSALALGLALGLGAVLVHLVGVVVHQHWAFAAVSAAQMGVPVAAATTGNTLGVLPEGESVAIILGAVVTMVVTALVSGQVAKEVSSASHGPEATVRP